MVYDSYFNKVVIKILPQYEITSKNKAPVQNQLSQQPSSLEDSYLPCKYKESENYYRPGLLLAQSFGWEV